MKKIVTISLIFLCLNLIWILAGKTTAYGQTYTCQWVDGRGIGESGECRQVIRRGCPNNWSPPVPCENFSRSECAGTYNCEFTGEIESVRLPAYPSDFAFANATLGDIVSQFLNYAIVIAGIAMFALLILGGFDLLTSAGDPEGIKRGTNKIIYAIVGFIIVMATYFILHIVELLFGIKIVS